MYVVGSIQSKIAWLIFTKENKKNPIKFNIVWHFYFRLFDIYDKSRLQWNQRLKNSNFVAPDLECYYSSIDRSMNEKRGIIWGSGNMMNSGLDLCGEKKRSCLKTLERRSNRVFRSKKYCVFNLFFLNGYNFFYFFLDLVKFGWVSFYTNWIGLFSFGHWIL